MKVILASYVLLGAMAGFATVSPANADESRINKQVIGVQDPQTGAFRPLTLVVPDAATTTTTTGTVDVSITIKLVSTFAKGSVLHCVAELDGAVTSPTAGTTTFYAESATEGVTVSGTTATCSLSIPYSWLLPSSSTTNVDSFSGTYTVLVEAATATGTLATTGLLTRSSSGGFVSSTKIPASGTTSKYAVSATL